MQQRDLKPTDNVCKKKKQYVEERSALDEKVHIFIRISSKNSVDLAGFELEEVSGSGAKLPCLYSSKVVRDEATLLLVLDLFACAVHSRGGLWPTSSNK
jgi:hypothetical protein